MCCSFVRLQGSFDKNVDSVDGSCDCSFGRLFVAVCCSVLQCVAVCCVFSCDGSFGRLLGSLFSCVCGSFDRLLGSFDKHLGSFDKDEGSFDKF